MQCPADQKRQQRLMHCWHSALLVAWQCLWGTELPTTRLALWERERDPARVYRDGGRQRLWTPPGLRHAEMDLPDTLHDEKLDKIVEAIVTTGQNLCNRVDAVAVEVGLLREDHKKLSARVANTESELKDLRPSLTELEEKVSSLTGKVRELERRAEYSEGWSRRNNIRIVGFPKGAEGLDPITFFETWLAQMVGVEALSLHYIVERAHRVPACRPPAGAPPRLVLIHFLNYRNKETVFQKTHTSLPHQYENSCIYFFPHHTATVQRQLTSFVGVKKRLCQASLTYSVLFPARLKVIADGTSFFYTEPTGAWDWVEQCRNEISKSSSPNAPPDRRQGRKHNRKAPQETGMDRVKAASTPAQARLEQKQALSAPMALWMDEGLTISQISNR
ncbi:hypothetical protein NDU88_003469 [Pleurodeles waltl]|uniref:Uncharacterized protein n=1 Tax=Pleurodeles waltl TaxID=8319 RepID=A0AAV7V0N9_PLEWA|nr:hypothetical protein NDU88_003469 [Pleurodeles waltl]